MREGLSDLAAYSATALYRAFTCDLFGIEALLVAVALAWAWRARRFPDAWFARIEAFGSRLALRPWRAVVIAGVSAVLLRTVLLIWLPVPHPVITDEFSHLLLADTLASGRLANPSHPMWPSFESIHVLHQPTYSSMYLPAQALFLAAAQALFGHPWIGVLLSMGLLAGALCWALQGWLPGRWALYGALIAVLKFGLTSYWINSYWGGTPGALGGALVLGALPRLEKRMHAGVAITLAVGLVLLANSRPYEGLALALPVAVRLGRWLLGRPLGALVRVAIPITATLALAGVGMALYFERVTGDALTMPYAVNQRIYGWPMTLPWTEVRPVFHTQPQLRDYYNYELGERLWHTIPASFIAKNLLKLERDWRFYLGPALTLLFLLLPWWYRDRRIRFLALAGAVVIFADALIPHFPHYLSPIAVVALALVVQGARHWRHSTIGQRMVRLIPVILALVVLCRAGASALKLPYQQSGGYTSWCCSDPGKVDQQRIAATLPAAARHLVLVRYRPSHWFVDEWVYNGADIDGARVVWARELGGEQDDLLVRYFSGRSVWLFEPDAEPPRLAPYRAGSFRANPMARDYFAGR